MRGKARVGTQIIPQALSSSRVGLNELENSIYEEAAKLIIEKLVFYPWENDGEKIAFIAHAIALMEIENRMVTY